MPSNTVQIVAPDYQLWSLRSPECEGTAHIISTPNTLAVMEYVVRVPVCLQVSLHMIGTVVRIFTLIASRRL